MEPCHVHCHLQHPTQSRRLQKFQGFGGLFPPVTCATDKTTTEDDEIRYIVHIQQIKLKGNNQILSQGKCLLFSFAYEHHRLLSSSSLLDKKILAGGQQAGMAHILLEEDPGSSSPVKPSPSRPRSLSITIWLAMQKAHVTSLSCLDRVDSSMIPLMCSMTKKQIILRSLD